MKEKDLEKNLDNIIIDGLIKEAEQDNADFEAAMRKMSNEEFEELIDKPTAHLKANFTKWRIFRPWIASAVAAAAVILIVLIPSVNSMNGKLCDSALYASSAYITPSKGGFDISSAKIDEIKHELPALQSRYDICMEETLDSKTNISNDLMDAGWDLAVAYLRLHKKGDAVEVLKTLAAKYPGTEFGKHCEMLLKQLD